MVHRSGAKPGDRVVVTGTIGDAASGLDILRGGAVAAVLADDAAAREMLVAAIACRSRARRWPEQFAITLMRRWMCPMVLRGSRQALRCVRRVRRYRRPERPLSAAAATLLARRTIGIETIVSGGDDYEILCAIRRIASRRSRKPQHGPGGRSFDRNGDRRGVGSEVSDAQGREIALQRLLTAISEMLRKVGSSSVSRKIPAEFDRFWPPQRCAGVRFWHGPAD